MTATELRLQAGVDAARRLAAQAGITPNNWRVMCHRDSEIPTEKLSLMKAAIAGMVDDLQAQIDQLSTLEIKISQSL